MKGKGRDQKVHKKIMPFPIGITTYPTAGGLLDQDYTLMEYFDIFLAAERKVFYDELKK